MPATCGVLVVVALTAVAAWLDRLAMIPASSSPQRASTSQRGPSHRDLVVQNTGDRPIQVGSHYHFAETNAALRFDRAAARGMRLNIASGTAVRFEPGPAAHRRAGRVRRRRASAYGLSAG